MDNKDADWDSIDSISFGDNRNSNIINDAVKNDENPFLELFEDYGIASFADKVKAVTGAETIEDLLLLSESNDMIDEAAKEMNMKMIHKIKFKNAMKSLLKCEKDGGTFNVQEGASNTEMNKVWQEKKIDSITIEGSRSNPDISEYIMVCIDRSFSMGLYLEEEKSWGENSSKTLARRSRMDAVKQIFYAFRDRTETLGSNSFHKIGLLSFDEKIEVHHQPTELLDTFEAIIDDIEKRGSTAIYSAVSKAAHMLNPYFKSHPKSDLRIICLTDGENNSGISPEQALLDVNLIGATVDAIIVGNSPDENLRKIVAATNGECYQIKSLTEGFQMMEEEGVVSLRSRRGGADKPVSKPLKINFSEIVGRELTRGAAAKDKSTKLKITGKVSALNSKFFERETNSSGSSRRIMKELLGVKNGTIWSQSGEGIYFFPNESDISQLRVLVSGPRESPFEGGVFLINVFIPTNYPFQPPKIMFHTPIYHCNVSESGAICLEVLSNWNPAVTIPNVIEQIIMLMKNPNPDDALRQWIAEEVIAYNRHGGDSPDGKRYIEKAKAKTRDLASFTVTQWKDKWAKNEESV